jgi:hypothetical protein
MLFEVRWSSHLISANGMILLIDTIFTIGKDREGFLNGTGRQTHDLWIIKHASLTSPACLCNNHIAADCHGNQTPCSPSRTSATLMLTMLSPDSMFTGYTFPYYKQMHVSVLGETALQNEPGRLTSYPSIPSSIGHRASSEIATSQFVQSSV